MTPAVPACVVGRAGDQSGDRSWAALPAGGGRPRVGVAIASCYRNDTKRVSMVEPSSPPASPPDIDGLSFEQALQELEQLVRRLEAGEVTLDESIEAYERGSRLKAHCERKLNEAQQKVERIARAADGSPSLEPFEGER